VQQNTAIDIFYHNSNTKHLHSPMSSNHAFFSEGDNEERKSGDGGDHSSNSNDGDDNDEDEMNEMMSKVNQVRPSQVIQSSRNNNMIKNQRSHDGVGVKCTGQNL
jgi:hypothetical protein